MEFIKEMYARFERLVSKVRYDRLLHFIMGIAIAAAVVILFPCIAVAGVLFATVAGIGKELFDIWRGSAADWVDCAYTIAGGAIVELLWLIHYLFTL